MFDDCDFQAEEITAQEQWQTTYIWDGARRTRLLIDHIVEIDQIVPNCAAHIPGLVSLEDLS